MKKLLLPFLFLLVSSVSFAQQAVVYTEDNPQYSIVVPKDWTPMEYTEYNLLEIYNRDESIIYSIYELETFLLYEAVHRVHEEAATEFIDFSLSVVIDEEKNGIVFHNISGSGTTKDSLFYNIEARLFRPGSQNFFMIYYSGLPKDIDYYQIEIDALNNSTKRY